MSIPFLKWSLVSLLLFSALHSPAQAPASVYHEPFRPQLHFSPKEKWTNDPNGLVYFQSTWHLFFQYYPGDIIWGPMHWGHATSKDLVHWRQQPVALYPDSLGYIFSGSAVVDSNNTSGFGKKGRIPLVAIFTQHDPVGEKNGSNTFQNQSIAYSLDNGRTWTKYIGNPVLKNPGITDFRDPNVCWYRPGKKWIMTLATKDRVTFYASADLKSWKKQSEFGQDLGAHGGVWECPDLFPLRLGKATYWVLLVSTNPGGPNGGSGTQYFIGQFDGKKFYPADNTVRWIDYGPDDYAGITWNNTGERKVFLGWMSNWTYASQLPTTTWRNAMTLPRELSLRRLDGGIYLCSAPVKELKSLAGVSKVLKEVTIDSITDLSSRVDCSSGLYKLTLKGTGLKDFFITFSNVKGEQMVVGYELASNRWYIDRSLSGVTDFNHEFPRKYFAPRPSAAGEWDLTIVMDASSLELFADKGLTVMSCLFFPGATLSHVQIGSRGRWNITQLSCTPLRSVWPSLP